MQQPIPALFGLERPAHDEREQAPGRAPQMGVERGQVGIQPLAERSCAGGFARTISANQGHHGAASAWTHPAIEEHRTEWGRQDLLAARKEQRGYRWRPGESAESSVEFTAYGRGFRWINLSAKCQKAAIEQPKVDQGKMLDQNGA